MSDMWTSDATAIRWQKMAQDLTEQERSPRSQARQRTPSGDSASRFRTPSFLRRKRHTSTGDEPVDDEKESEKVEEEEESKSPIRARLSAPFASIRKKMQPDESKNEGDENVKPEPKWRRFLPGRERSVSEDESKVQAVKPKPEGKLVKRVDRPVSFQTPIAVDTEPEEDSRDRPRGAEAGRGPTTQQQRDRPTTQQQQDRPYEDNRGRPPYQELNEGQYRPDAYGDRGPQYKDSYQPKGDRGYEPEGNWQSKEPDYSGRRGPSDDARYPPEYRYARPEKAYPEQKKKGSGDQYPPEYQYPRAERGRSYYDDDRYEPNYPEVQRQNRSNIPMDDSMDDQHLTTFPTPGNLTEESRTEEEDDSRRRKKQPRIQKERPKVSKYDNVPHKRESNGQRPHYYDEEPRQQKSRYTLDPYDDDDRSNSKKKKDPRERVQETPKRASSQSSGKKKPTYVEEHRNFMPDYWEADEPVTPKRKSRDPDKQRLIDEEDKRAQLERSKELAKRKKKKEAEIAEIDSRRDRERNPRTSSPRTAGRSTRETNPKEAEANASRKGPSKKYTSSQQRQSYDETEDSEVPTSPTRFQSKRTQQRVPNYTSSEISVSTAASRERDRRSEQLRGSLANIFEEPEPGRNNRVYYLAWLLAQILAGLAVVLITLWCVLPGRGNGDPPGNIVITPSGAPNTSGFAWTSKPDTMFNLHPFLMFVGFVYLIVESTLLYRTFFCIPSNKLKYVHALLMCVAFVAMVIGLFAVFTYKDSNRIGNLITSHSFLGIIAVVVFSIQFAISSGLFNIFFSTPEEIRAEYQPVHQFFGLVILFLTMLVSMTGMTQSQVRGFSAAGLLSKFFVIAILFLAVVVAFLIGLNRNKKPTPKSDEMSPLTSIMNRNYTY